MHFFLVVPTLDETEEASIIARLTKLHIQVAPGTNKAMTHIKLDTASSENNLMTIHQQLSRSGSYICVPLLWVTTWGKWSPTQQQKSRSKVHTHGTTQNFLVLLWLYKEVMDYPTCFQDRSLQINQDLAASQKNQLNVKDIQLYSLPTDRIRVIREGVAVVPPHEGRSYHGMVRLVE